MPLMNIIIRPAVKEDCPEMLELIRELAVYEKAPDEVTVSLDHFIETGFGEQPVWWAYVATINQEEANAEEANTLQVPPPLLWGEDGRGLIGFALYYIRYSTWKGKKMYLEDILVTEQWRGKGIGTQLMNALIEDAKSKDFQGITWQVLDWNEPAIHFYKRYDPTFDAEWVNVMLNFR
jgi:GNAT superfamily N-acetyltransferase